MIYEDGRCYSNKSKKFLTPQMSVKYPTYNLTLNGKKQKIKVHRLVAETFIPNPENKPIVNHLDGDTHNYHRSNLEWATAKENSKHAANSGLLKKSDQTKIYLNDYIIPNEIWTQIPGYNNYKISNYGRIVNITNNTLKRTPLDNNGYPHVNLWEKGKNKTFQVHKLEYMAFNLEENINNKVVNHIDGDKTNNNLNNLELITYAENNFHAEYKINTHKTSKIVQMINDEENVIKEFPSIAEAQRLLSISNISRAIKKHYKINGYYWKYK